MNVGRLMHLETVLWRVLDERKSFDLALWAVIDQHDCCTVACAGGYAAIDPVFQAQGLYLGYKGGIPLRKATRCFLGQPKIYFRASNGKLYSEFEAAARFFEITMKQTEWLFARFSYPAPVPPGPEDVIARLNELVPSHKPDAPVHRERELVMA
jgi:hypothetical protein